MREGGDKRAGEIIEGRNAGTYKVRNRSTKRCERKIEC